MKEEQRMSLPAFDYVKAGSLEEASRLAREKGTKAVLIVTYQNKCQNQGSG